MLKPIDDLCSVFQEMFKPIEDFIKESSIPIVERAKLTAKVIHFADECNPYINQKSNKKAKTIHANYGSRNTRVIERRRQEEYINDFDPENCQAIELIKKFYGGKIPPSNFLRGLFKILEDEKMLKVPREAKRSNKAIKKFIQDNIDFFQKLYDEGWWFDAGDPTSK